MAAMRKPSDPEISGPLRSVRWKESEDMSPFVLSLKDDPSSIESVSGKKPSF